MPIAETFGGASKLSPDPNNLPHLPIVCLARSETPGILVMAVRFEVVARTLDTCCGAFGTCQAPAKKALGPPKFGSWVRHAGGTSSTPPDRVLIEAYLNDA